MYLDDGIPGSKNGILFNLYCCMIPILIMSTTISLNLIGR